MDVDGISKADIFDEYFDDEKPKYNGKKPKYIIKNYPATSAGCCGDICPEITDCPLKQIVEKCKYWETYEDYYDCVWGGTFGTEILKLLDIQEVE